MSAPSSTPSELNLRQALGAARDAGQEAAVVFRLKADDATLAPDPETTERVARALVARVAERLGREPALVNVFRNLGSLVVRADPEFLILLLDQPEVAAATLNRPSRPVAEPIRPVRKRADNPAGWEDG